ncbi:hypothetical protein [Solitalea lacus]|uniref:hypothetical protein n=1 Tax=Solitalea lacus TaxID=2911172 RepID=UPI001ED9F4C1|nr:hypothetical protein [Solitalea lacus]UKJ07553.1 hypothetical protein L2B55_18800 [Solitalea lacus]
MNSTLSMHRLGLLFKKDWVENWTSYLFILTAIIAIIPLMLKIENVVKRGNEEIVAANVSMGLLFITTVWLPILRFNQFSKNEKALNFLILPATAFEKFLVNWVYAIPFSILPYVIMHLYFFEYKLNHLHIINDSYMDYWLLYASVFFIGNLLFKRYAGVKCFLLIAVVLSAILKFGDTIESRWCIKTDFLFGSFNYYIVSGFLVAVSVLIWILCWQLIKKKQA